MRVFSRSMRWVCVPGVVVAMPLVFHCTAAFARHDPGYEAIDLGTLGGESSIALGINQKNEVVGAAQTADGRWHAFLWVDGQMTDLGVLEGFDESFAYGLNEARQAVGQAATLDGSGSRAFAWSGGNRVDLGTLGGAGSRARGINSLS